MPQTKREIQAMLEAAGIRPNRRLGQSFLIDGNLMRKLVESAEIPRDAVVLEVGSGTGSLTEMLLERARHVVAVEIDPGLQEIVAGRLGERPNLTLLRGDALANKNRLAPELIDAVRTAAGGSAFVMLVANLPFQIASPLLANLVLGGLGVRRMCFTVQTEVADRIASPPGRKSYGPLSITLQAFCDVRTIARLAPSVFWPVPSVASTMLRLDYSPVKASRIVDPEGFVRVVRACFTHRRKKLAHALEYLFGGRRGDVPPELTAFETDRRPEELTVEEWIGLAHRVLSLGPEGLGPWELDEDPAED